MAVQVITDSGADLSPEAAAQYGITVVPLTVRFGLDEYVVGKDLSNNEFWARMESSDELPATAAPSPGAFSQAFASAGEDGAVCISLSGKLSGTYQAAMAGAGGVDQKVAVVDSLTCTVAQAGLCLEAAERASKGQTVDEIVAAVTELRGRTHMYGVLDTLDNLRKGGRIGSAGAFFGSLLSIKPVITIEGGAVKAESRQRTRKKSLAHLADLVRGGHQVERVAVAHANAPDLEDFLALLGEFVDRRSIHLSNIGPVIGTHGGPRLIAVSFATGSVR